MLQQIQGISQAVAVAHSMRILNRANLSVPSHRSFAAAARWGDTFEIKITDAKTGETVFRFVQE